MPFPALPGKSGASRMASKVPFGLRASSATPLWMRPTGSGRVVSRPASLRV